MEPDFADVVHELDVDLDVGNAGDVCVNSIAKGIARPGRPNCAIGKQVDWIARGAFFQASGGVAPRLSNRSHDR